MKISPVSLVLILFWRRLWKSILSSWTMMKITLLIHFNIFLSLFFRALRITFTLRFFLFFMVIIVFVHFPLFLIRWIRLVRRAGKLLADGFSSRIFPTHNFMIVEDLLRILLLTILTRLVKLAFSFMRRHILFAYPLATVLAFLLALSPRNVSISLFCKPFALHQMNTESLLWKKLRTFSAFFTVEWKFNLHT